MKDIMHLIIRLTVAAERTLRVIKQKHSNYKQKKKESSIALHKTLAKVGH